MTVLVGRDDVVMKPSEIAHFKECENLLDEGVRLVASFALVALNNTIYHFKITTESPTRMQYASICQIAAKRQVRLF